MQLVSGNAIIKYVSPRLKSKQYASSLKVGAEMNSEEHIQLQFGGFHHLFLFCNKMQELGRHWTTTAPLHNSGTLRMAEAKGSRNCMSPTKVSLKPDLQDMSVVP